jgi:FKBP-type peptidyl-prolyl cis-trans isomerase FkpA
MRQRHLGKGIALAGLALLGWLACEQKAGQAPAAEGGQIAAAPGGQIGGGEDGNTIYALGLALARELAPFSLTESEIAALEEGLRDGVLGRPPRVDLEQQGPQIQALAKARLEAAAAVEKKESDAFLTTAAAAPKAEKLPSGLIYQEVSPGSGPSPQVSDTVKVHYHGTLRDGSVFDSSVERGAPVEFPLNRVIPCWTEGVQKMKVGGKAHFTCPAEIAYGERGAPPKIKPGAALAFDVELLEIVPASATPALPEGHPKTGD